VGKDKSRESAAKVSPAPGHPADGPNQNAALTRRRYQAKKNCIYSASFPENTVEGIRVVDLPSA
jgi:hypothetical protein